MEEVALLLFFSNSKGVVTVAAGAKEVGVDAIDERGGTGLQAANSAITFGEMTTALVPLHG